MSAQKFKKSCCTHSRISVPLYIKILVKVWLKVLQGQLFCVQTVLVCMLFLHIYILGVFTEKPYSKPLECNVPVLYSNNIESRDITDVKINHGFLQSDWMSALFYG